MTQARGDSVLLTSFRTGSICQNGGERTMHQCFCHGPKLLYSFLQRIFRTKKFSKFQITSSSHWSCQDWTCDWNWSIQVCKNFVGCASIVTNTQEIGSLGCEYHEDLNNYARQFVPTETDHQNLEAVSSQQSMGCGRPSAQETVGNSPVRYKAAPKKKLILIGFSQRVWKMIHAEALTKRDCEFVHISKHFTKSLRHTHWQEADGALRGNHVWQTCHVPSTLSTWTEKSGLMHLVALLKNPARSIERITTEPSSTFVQCKDTVMVPDSIQRCCLSQRDRWIGRNAHSTRTALPNSKCISENGLWAGGLSLRRTRQACFLSRVNPQDSSSRQRTTNRTGQFMNQERSCTSKAIAQIMGVFSFNLRRKLGTSPA